MNEELELYYGAICYNVLTAGAHHPSYLVEKSDMLKDGEMAFVHLDIFNQALAIQYCKDWNIPVPPAWQELHTRSVIAANELREKGFDL